MKFFSARFGVQSLFLTFARTTFSFPSLLQNVTPPAGIKNSLPGKDTVRVDTAGFFWKNPGFNVFAPIASSEKEPSIGAMLTFVPAREPELVFGM